MRGIFCSKIKQDIIVGLFTNENQKNISKINATELTKICNLKRVPSEELDILMARGIIFSKKNGKERIVCLTDKGKLVAHCLNELNSILN